MNQERSGTTVINSLFFFFFFFTAYKKRKSKRTTSFGERWMDSILDMQSQDLMDHLKKDTELWFREEIWSGADSIPKYSHVESLSDCFGECLYSMSCPMSESPSGKREGFQDNATRKKREVYYWLEPGLLPQPMQWCRVRKAPSPSCYPNL